MLSLQRPRRGNRTLLAAVIFSAYFFISLNFTVLTVLIPRIALEFNATIEQAEWVTIGPILVSTVLAPSLGTMADQYRMRTTIWWIGFAIHIFALAIAGLARSLPVLLLARALSGVASACDEPTGIAILMSGLSPDERGRMAAVRTAVTTIAPSVGVSVGSWVAEAAGWRVIFLGPLLPLILVWGASLLVLPFDSVNWWCCGPRRAGGSYNKVVDAGGREEEKATGGEAEGEIDGEEECEEISRTDQHPEEEVDTDIMECGAGEGNGSGRRNERSLGEDNLVVPLDATLVHVSTSHGVKEGGLSSPSSPSPLSSPPASPRRFDWAGTAAFVIGMGSALVAISRGNDLGWNSTAVVALFVIAAVHLTALYPIERHCAAKPIIPGFIFTDPIIFWTNLCALLATACYMTTLMLLPTYLQEAHGFSVGFTGLLVFLRPGIGTLVSTIIARVLDRSPNGIAPASLVRVGACLFVAAYSLIAAAVTWAPRSALPPLVVLFVILQPIAHYPVSIGLQAMALKRVGEEELSQFMGSRSLVKSTGYLIAITAGMAAVRMTGAFAERTSYVPVFWGIVGFIAIVLPIVFVPRCGVPPARRDFYNGRTSRFAWCRMACRVGPCCSPCCSARTST